MNILSENKCLRSTKPNVKVRYSPKEDRQNPLLLFWNVQSNKQHTTHYCKLTALLLNCNQYHVNINDFEENCHLTGTWTLFPADHSSFDSLNKSSYFWQCKPFLQLKVITCNIAETLIFWWNKYFHYFHHSLL